MNFLAPLFLLGGLLVAVPIVLHLTRRRREPVPFPSFLLLQLTSATARFKRRRFRNIPLMLLRCLALLLLAAAFAEPVLRGGALAGGEAAALDRAVLVDRSLSMTVGNRMEAAREAAQDELSGLGREDRAIVVAFDGRAAALTELTGDPGALAPAVTNLTAGGGGTSFAPALGLAGRLLPASAGRRREVVLISDLQRSGFEDGRPQPSLPPGVELRVRQVSASPPANAWIADVTVVSEGREQLVVTAEVGFAPSPANPEWSGEIELLLSGRQVDRENLTAAADRMTTVRFDPVLRPSEPLAAEVRLPGDGFPGDDRFHLVIHPEAAIRVADLGGSPPSVYVSEALGVGVAPGFLLDRAPARGEGAVRGALDAARVALVRDPGRLDAGAVRALGDFVEGGGGPGDGCRTAPPLAGGDRGTRSVRPGGAGRVRGPRSGGTHRRPRRPASGLRALRGRGFRGPRRARLLPLPEPRRGPAGRRGPGALRRRQAGPRGVGVGRREDPAVRFLARRGVDRPPPAAPTFVPLLHRLVGGCRGSRAHPDRLPGRRERRRHLTSFLGSCRESRGPRAAAW